MTTDHETPPDDEQNECASSSQPMLNFDPQSLVAMRVRPAQFARLCQVSKQAVSDWVRRGVITLGPDGLVDPIAASRQVFNNTDPARLRARLFKGLARDVPELTEKNRELRAELKTARAQIEELQATCAGLESALAAMTATRLHPDDVAMRLSDYIDAIVREFAALSAAHATGNLEEALDGLSADAFDWLMPENVVGICDRTGPLDDEFSAGLSWSSAENEAAADD